MTSTPLDQATTDYTTADAAYTKAEATAETARVKAAAATKAASDADQARMQALSDKMTVEKARAADVHRAVANTAGQRIADAAAAQAAALERFHTAIAATEWGTALIDWMHARQRIRAWELRQVGSLRALGQRTVDSSAQYEPGPNLPGDQLAELMARAIVAGGLAAATADDATLDGARQAYINGTSTDPEPPAGT